jgi:hypothetical protein
MLDTGLQCCRDFIEIVNAKPSVTCSASQASFVVVVCVYILVVWQFVDLLIKMVDFTWLEIHDQCQLFKCKFCKKTTMNCPLTNKLYVC